MPNWDKIQNEWETTKITFKALAEKHGLKDSTIRSRKNREKWERNATDDNATQRKSVATKKKSKEPVVMSDNLTDKQRLFCIYFIKYFNATKAYQRAYECDYVTARTNGSRLLTNANIKAEVERMKQEQTSGLLLDVKDVIQKYIDIAFADITDFVEFGGKELPMRDSFSGELLIDNEGNPLTEHHSFVDVKNSDDVDGTIINEVKQGKDGISVKLADRMKALDMLAKYTDLLSDNDKKKLQEEKLKADIAKTAAETKNEETGSTTITIVDEWADTDAD